MRFNIIGAGRLGKAIARALNNLQGIKLEAVCSANFLSAQGVIDQLGSGVAVAALNQLPLVELSFITTPDDQIAKVAQQLAQEKIIAPQSLVLHCSGVLPSTVLSPLRALDCQIASLHPPKAFGPEADETVFRDCACVIEGDRRAVEIITPLFNKLGARLIPIKTENKTLYHAASVMAANYLVTLAAAAIELFSGAGITEEVSRQMTTQLMTSSLDNIRQADNLAAALTGPLQRGDLKTLARHMEALPEGEIKELYRSAALATLSLTDLSEEQRLLLQRVLAI